jgi:hypothetical protein
MWHGGWRASRTPCEALIFLFLAPEVGEETRLGGELRREERVLSRTGMCMDRVGTVNDLSEGGFARLSSLAPAKGGVAHEQRLGLVRLDKHKVPNLDDQRPRRGWSMPHIVETSDTFFHSACKMKCIYKYSHKIIKIHVYVYVLDGIATANGEVGISGSRSSPC